MKDRPLKQHNITERRIVNYVNPVAVAGMEMRTVYKIAESCILPADAYQGTFSATKKMEFRIGIITRALDDENLLGCFDYIEGAEKLVRTLGKRKDRLLILECDGFTDGSWDVPPENKARGRTSIKVKGIRPVKVVRTYYECMERR